MEKILSAKSKLKGVACSLWHHRFYKAQKQGKLNNVLLRETCINNFLKEQWEMQLQDFAYHRPTKQEETPRSFWRYWSGVSDGSQMFLSQLMFYSWARPRKHFVLMKYYIQHYRHKPKHPVTWSCYNFRTSFFHWIFISYGTSQHLESPQPNHVQAIVTR